MIRSKKIINEYGGKLFLIYIFSPYSCGRIFQEGTTRTNDIIIRSQLSSQFYGNIDSMIIDRLGYR